MSVRVEERMIDTVSGPRRTWVIAPKEDVVVGRARLEHYRSGGHQGAPIDREILDAVRALGDVSQLIVFLGDGKTFEDSEPAGIWTVDPELSIEEARELGYHLVRDQLPTYRSLVRAGVYALLHVGFGSREVEIYQHGTRRMLEELEARSIPEVQGDASASTRLSADRWILHNLTFFFTLSLEDVVQSVLRRQLPLLEKRVPHLRDLFEPDAVQEA